MPSRENIVGPSGLPSLSSNDKQVAVALPAFHKNDEIHRHTSNIPGGNSSVESTESYVYQEIDKFDASIQARLRKLNIPPIEEIKKNTNVRPPNPYCELFYPLWPDDKMFKLINFYREKLPKYLSVPLCRAMQENFSDEQLNVLDLLNQYISRPPFSEMVVRHIYLLLDQANNMEIALAKEQVALLQLHSEQGDISGMPPKQ